ncbi:TOBE domain-containing protein [uncultured Desulfobacter sp.]|uniref:TOBE domain-containing protein n=1 Tax=uncultured Desulfobacter sp. TaxID=240139 RepID=UPI002AABBEA9|nr:TOBE domain-containing protein [uncultured Desulfobacter sp.]
MTLSARNLLKGTVKEVKKGQVMAEATIEVAPGVDITSTITTSSVEKLGITKGKEVTVVIKATSVMLDA